MFSAAASPHLIDLRKSFREIPDITSYYAVVNSMYNSVSPKKSLAAKATRGCCPHIRALGLQRHVVLTNFSPTSKGSGGSLSPHLPGNNHPRCAASPAASVPVYLSVELRVLLKVLKNIIPTEPKPGTAEQPPETTDHTGGTFPCRSYAF